jgi:hypothetical protein
MGHKQIRSQKNEVAMPHVWTSQRFRCHHTSCKRGTLTRTRPLRRQLLIRYAKRYFPAAWNQGSLSWKQLAQWLAASRTPLRYALNVLSSDEGLFAGSGARGYVVRRFSVSDVLARSMCAEPSKVWRPGASPSDRSTYDSRNRSKNACGEAMKRGMRR